MPTTTKFEDLSYLERAHLHQVDPEAYRALKEAFERRVAADIRKGILTREHRAWLSKEALKVEKERMRALLGWSDEEQG